ncbi:camphor resistance protein CrcB (plasmid) [Cellulomonas sp. WB94]|uniref:fluoride efflux transporter FluC n=1 Tax=Cellulomonas sp. WB94 TaxID=2173174 RepID=UPI000D584E96|nr:CrcB family protein [Cellulomonas sp. WB94]PVU84290.1 camphor resistance protein CrcB [Cellulomonas sp. WB94]
MTAAHHLNPRLVALVALGGMIGTTGRYLLSLALPNHGGWPVATFVANVVGSFLLGALLEALLRRGGENPRRRAVRLGLGTGVLGGFTTFSSLALELERLLAHDALLTAATYAVASLACGLLACLLGVAVAARLDVRRRARGRGRSDSPASEGAR